MRSKDFEIVSFLYFHPPQRRFASNLSRPPKDSSLRFPEKWPAFIPITVQLLNTNDASSIFAGLTMLLAIVVVFRFK